MLDAIENNDNAIHFSEAENTADARLVNRGLNRVAHILYNVKSETAQQEKYYELILDCVNTGILVPVSYTHLDVYKRQPPHYRRKDVSCGVQTRRRAGCGSP